MLDVAVASVRVAPLDVGALVREAVAGLAVRGSERHGRGRRWRHSSSTEITCAFARLSTTLSRMRSSMVMAPRRSPSSATRSARGRRDRGVGYRAEASGRTTSRASSSVGVRLSDGVRRFGARTAAGAGDRRGSRRRARGRVETRRRHDVHDRSSRTGLSARDMSVRARMRGGAVHRFACSLTANVASDVTRSASSVVTRTGDAVGDRVHLGVARAVDDDVRARPGRAGPRRMPPVLPEVSRQVRLSLGSRRRAGIDPTECASAPGASRRRRMRARPRSSCSQQA